MNDAIALVIDDDRSVHDEVDRALGPPLISRVEHAFLPGDGIRAAVELLPDLILLDIHMPEIDGFKVCRVLKENASTRDIPILFLTVETKADHIARALDCGAVDYVSKPFNHTELQARIRVALRSRDLIELLKEQARVDALTGLLNRAALDDALRAAASAHERIGQSASLLLLDVDHFKATNDQHGHGVGDEVLRAVGRCLRACCRPYDVACRFGGDEFAVIFAQTDSSGAITAAERMISGIRELRIECGDSEDVAAVTVSGGLVSGLDGVDFFEVPELMEAADVALYRAKEQGRNRLVVVDLADFAQKED